VERNTIILIASASLFTGILIGISFGYSVGLKEGIEIINTIK